MRQRIYIFIAVYLVIRSVVPAQQMAMYTQYMFNGLALNPAYAGSHETISATGLMRIQWVGVEGAPQTQTFSIHSPIPGKSAAFGAVFSHDNLGITNQDALNISFAYRIKGPKTTLAFGIQGGFVNYDISFGNLGIADPQLQSVLGGFKPNFGAGIYIYSEKFYFGASAPMILRNDITAEEQTNVDIQSTQLPHWFVTAGTLIDLSAMVKMKPSFLVKSVEGAPLEFDVNTNFILDDKLWLGLSYRTSGSVSFLTDLQINTQLRVGYAYDYALSDINQITSGSHEFVINYRLVYKSEKIQSPRYF